MAIKTSDELIITDNASEQIKVIDDGERFAIISRLKGNGSRPDSVTIFNPVEFRDLVNWGKARLFARFE